MASADSARTRAADTEHMAKDCPGMSRSLWVCENHPDQPWDGASSHENACGCGAGAPCPRCNVSDRDHPPKMPEGYRTIIGREGVEALIDQDSAWREKPYHGDSSRSHESRNPVLSRYSIRLKTRKLNRNRLRHTYRCAEYRFAMLTNSSECGEMITPFG